MGRLEGTRAGGYGQGGAENPPRRLLDLFSRRQALFILPIPIPIPILPLPSLSLVSISDFAVFVAVVVAVFVAVALVCATKPSMGPVAARSPAVVVLVFTTTSGSWMVAACWAASGLVKRAAVDRARIRGAGRIITLELEKPGTTARA